MTHRQYIVMSTAAKMPVNCWGRYRNVAVVELEDGFSGTPKMISERARGVKRVVAHYGPQNVGVTERCAYNRTWRRAEALCEELASAGATTTGATKSY